MTDTRRIEDASISPLPKGLFDPMPTVNVILEDGTEVELFSYYPDEISFVASEFVGLTLDEARNLKFKKDKAFLQT